MNNRIVSFLDLKPYTLNHIPCFYLTTGLVFLLSYARMLRSGGGGERSITQYLKGSIIINHGKLPKHMAA